MRLILQFAALITLSLTLSGCGKDWLIGKWEFDKERTLDAMTPPEDPETNNLLSGVVSGLQRGLSQLLFTQFDGVTIEYTKNEMRRTKNGVGEAIGYKVIEEVDEKTRVIQYDDGDIVTVQRVEDGLKSLMMGEHKVWVYFKPVAN
ncbi:MAG: hypothetical protein CMO61_00310 [Verrucomicrobiales bacterium]|jgi:hypothetical protein|nr:hypothetical protein [Verrucomicrobiales bacterium]|tara:strand:- start:13469 stop:13906 length:438 start_codon:yes stop_codon:yes gene_type:complete